MSFPIARVVAMIAALSLSPILAGCASSGCTTCRATRDGALVHIKSGPAEAHKVMMGLKMAMLMSEDRDALVYFDVHGIDVVLKDSPVLHKDPFGDSKTAIADLIARGVGVYACPGCLEAKGHTPDELLDGVRVANKEAFFGFTGGRIITLDY